MKKFTLFVALLLPLFATSQITYHHYLDSSVVWFEHHGWAMFGGPNCVQGGDGSEYTRYHVVGWDSLAGEAWYKIHYDWTRWIYCIGYPPVNSVGQSPPGEFMRLREDSLGNIWTIDGSLTQRLLYAFSPSLGIGDVLTMDNNQVPFVIDSIDTVYIGTEPRRRYWPDCSQGPWDAQYVVEGIGYILTVWDQYWFCQTFFDNSSTIVCYQRHDDTLTLDSNFVCGTPDHNPLVSVVDADLAALALRWDAAGYTLQVIGADLPSDLQWQVVDMRGAVLRRGNELVDQIALPGLAAGIYLFVAATDGQQFVRRFVQQ